MVRKIPLIFGVIGLLSSCQPREDVRFLSNLSATSDSPLYSTYAAAMERSEFIVDEGYEYRFYQEDAGIDFTTDTGGDLGIGFVIDGKWIYKQRDFYRKVVITHSYPDMVKSFYYPIEGLRVESTFLVESSSTIIHEINVRNESHKPVSIKIIPFMHNDYRSFNRVENLDDSTFYFTHEEYPDSWTISHNIPFEDTLQNIFMISEKPAAKGSFNSSGSESPSIPWVVSPDKKSMYELSGRTLINGERNNIGIPRTRFYSWVDGDMSLLVTENSPVWGTLQGAINSDGYYRAELGNLKAREGSEFEFFVYLEELELSAKRIGILGEHFNTGGNLELTPYDGVPVVKNPVAKVNDGIIRIEWEEPANASLTTRLYKRKYPDESAYKLVRETDSNSFTLDIEDPEICGYFLCHYDPLLKIMGPNTKEFTTIDPVNFDEFCLNFNSEAFSRDLSRYLAFGVNLKIDPNTEKTFRCLRMVGRESNNIDDILEISQSKISIDLQSFLEQNEQLFSMANISSNLDPDLELLYWSSFNMMRQVFYPPEGKSDFNYYVFSREPTWGWGHGGQVFHESLTIPAYALLDPKSAMNSQRVYSQRQYKNGYINYRTGSYLDEIIEYNDQLTSSAPWYNYQNWELYQVTEDMDFLREMYQSGKKFYNFYISNRDEDSDGLCEWGGHAILESVRDAYVAVWDEVGWPSNFEAVDLNCMLVMEAKALEKMARELDLDDEADNWNNDWSERSRLINEIFWDESTGFYYHVDKTDHDFSFKKQDDLKREEIIGFLPLWAGVADKHQAVRLMEKLQDPDKFWRKYGIPSLSADDSYYNDKGYWNGPVWVEWNYLIVKGLLDYGYDEEARSLTRNVANGMIIQLKENHNLWEFYSPDTTWAGYHKTYFWAGIINKMIWDVYQKTNEPI